MVLLAVQNSGCPIFFTSCSLEFRYLYDDYLIAIWNEDIKFNIFSIRWKRSISNTNYFLGDTGTIRPILKCSFLLWKFEWTTIKFKYVLYFILLVWDRLSGSKKSLYSHLRARTLFLLKQKALQKIIRISWNCSWSKQRKCTSFLSAGVHILGLMKFSTQSALCRNGS